MSNPKTDGVTSELQDRLRKKEAVKARDLLVLAGKMTNYESLMFIKNRIKDVNGFHTKQDDE